MARLLLFSEMPIVAEGVAAMVCGSAGFEMVSVCDTLEELRSVAALTQPSIVLLDFTAGFEAASLNDFGWLLKARSVVLLVYEITREAALQAISAGARGILCSTLPADMVRRCLQTVHQGEIWFEKAVDGDPPELRRAALTGRETQLIRLLGMGLKNREIANSLDITEGTVKVYLSRLFQKLGVKDRFELALYGMKAAVPAQSRLSGSPLEGRVHRPPAD